VMLVVGASASVDEAAVVVVVVGASASVDGAAVVVVGVSAGAGVGCSAGAGAESAAGVGAGSVAGAGAGAGSGAGAGAGAGSGAGAGVGAGSGTGAGAGAGAVVVAVDVVGALTGAVAVEVVSAAAATTGAVAPATGRSAAAVDVAMLQAERKAASVRTREPRRTRRVPCGPVCRSCRRVRSCGPRRYNGFPQACRRRSLLGVAFTSKAPRKPRVQRSNMPLVGRLAPLEAQFRGSARAERSLQQAARGADFGLESRRAPLERPRSAAAGAGAGGLRTLVAELHGRCLIGRAAARLQAPITRSEGGGAPLRRLSQRLAKLPP
jgi:hypothetical protein